MCVDVKVLDSDGSAVVRPSSPRIIGIAVRRDHESDGRPFKSWANQAVRGIVGVSRPIRFSYTDGSVEGQDLLSRRGGIIVKGESGVEDAVAEGGYVYWGTDTLSEDPIWQFYHVVRGRDYIELGQLKTLRYYLGRFNITLQTVNAIINTMTSHLTMLKANNDILDFRVGFERDKNSPEQLRLGHLTVMFKAEEPPVLRKLTISSRRYREALDTLIAQIATQLDVA
jgi:phage tail sheath protein FI